MILGPLTTPIDLRDLKRAGIVERDDPPRWAGFMVGPQMMPPQGTPATDVVMGSVLTHRQRPDGWISRSVRDWKEHDQRRQEDATRYLMTSLHIDIPEFYRAPEEHDGGDDEE
ncbi:hypothetical protein R6Q59_030515 [Mikania micrantha]